jgi:hypothetical protein
MPNYREVPSKIITNKNNRTGRISYHYAWFCVWLWKGSGHRKDGVLDLFNCIQFLSNAVTIISHNHRMSTSYHSDLPTYFHLQINIFLSFLFVFLGDKWKDLLLSTVISLVFHTQFVTSDTPLIIQDSVFECTIVVTVKVQQGTVYTCFLECEMRL